MLPVGGAAAGQGPLLVGAVGAGPDLHLGAGAAVAGVVEALAGVGVEQLAVGLRFPDLGAGAVAGVQVDEGAVGGAGRVDVQALAEHLQGVAGRDRPLLGAGAVAGVDLDRVEVRGAGRAVIQAQALVPGDRPGGPRRAAPGGRTAMPRPNIRATAAKTARSRRFTACSTAGWSCPAQAQICTWVPEPP